MVIYQFSKHPNKIYFVDHTVQAMFGCRIGETDLRTSQGGENI